MLTIFQVCFFVGIALTVISFLFGHVFEILGVDGLDLDIGIDLWLPVSPMIYTLFAIVFGGIGTILMKSDTGRPVIFITIIAAASGIIASSLLQKFIITPLKKAQSTSAPETDELIGLEATVIESISKHKFGQISYIFSGNTYTAPAKATREVSLEAGSKVAICWIEDYVFYVSNIDE